MAGNSTTSLKSFRICLNKMGFGERDRR